MEAIAEAKSKKRKKQWQTLRGMRDLLPGEQKYWQWVINKAVDLAAAHGFLRLDTPILEEASLFEKGTGKQTDVVEKEMFVFEERGGAKVALRPEFTPPFARAYIEHGMLNLPQPVKLYTIGPLFRHDRPQAGRYRQFHQFNAEVIGEDDPVLDAQLILLANTLFKSCGLEVVTHINSIGSPASRQPYLEALVAYYKRHKRSLCEDCQQRLTKNTLRLLDCKNEICQPFKGEAPQIVDWVSEEERDHFFKVVEYLDELKIDYFLNPFLVRGLDYYTRTVFEFYLAEDSEGASAESSGVSGSSTTPGLGAGAQTALGGGGRYDELVELLGGREATPAGGFSKSGLKQQLEMANRHAVEFTLIIGQKEMLEDTILVREMDGGMQETVPFAKIVDYLQKRT